MEQLLHVSLNSLLIRIVIKQPRFITVLGSIGHEKEASPAASNRFDLHGNIEPNFLLVQTESFSGWFNFLAQSRHENHFHAWIEIAKNILSSVERKGIASRWCGEESAITLDLLLYLESMSVFNRLLINLNHVNSLESSLLCMKKLWINLT